MSIIIILAIIHRLCPASAIAGIWGTIVGSLIGIFIKLCC